MLTETSLGLLSLIFRIIFSNFFADLLNNFELVDFKAFVRSYERDRSKEVYAPSLFRQSFGQIVAILLIFIIIFISLSLLIFRIILDRSISKFLGSNDADGSKEVYTPNQSYLGSHL